MKRTILVLSLATLFAGCTAEPVVPVTTPTVEDKTPAQQEQGALRSFFPPDGSTAYFQGEGNEFAGYTLRTTFLDAEHIAQLEDNGGVVLLKIYRITNTTIDLVFQEPVDSEPALPSAQRRSLTLCSKQFFSDHYRWAQAFKAGQLNRQTLRLIQGQQSITMLSS